MEYRVTAANKSFLVCADRPEDLLGEIIKHMAPGVRARIFPSQRLPGFYRIGYPTTKAGEYAFGAEFILTALDENGYRIL